MGDNKERCIHCKHLRKLKHNFSNGEGFEYSHCCIALLTFDTEDTTAEPWVQEVSVNDKCELFEREGK